MKAYCRTSKKHKRPDNTKWLCNLSALRYNMKSFNDFYNYLNLLCKCLNQK